MKILNEHPERWTFLGWTEGKAVFVNATGYPVHIKPRYRVGDVLRVKGTDTRLRVTAVKDPHQIQNISEKDAIAEGFKISGKDGRSQGYPWTEIFRAVWDNLHPKPGERWEDNCWVFGYEIERIER